MPPKSIFRQPGAKHFQLVHRSQRDPLIHDEDASKHVLKPVIRENQKKGKSRADLEAILSTNDLNDEAKVGEAAQYGIYYDDTEYDYMQHLRPFGVHEDGVESILIEAPNRPSKSQPSKDETKGFSLKDLPSGVLPSSTELERTYESQQAIPESIAGFQPDMNPHLRQTLEALEDDAFVDDALDDDFFSELIKDGARDAEDELEFEFHEDGDEEETANIDEEPSTWEERFVRFKSQQHHDHDSDEDTVQDLPDMSVIGGSKRRRRKGTSEASGYSMSSSSMVRNAALQTLDDRFDHILKHEYDEDEDEEVSSDESSEEEEVPELIESREDFESMVNEFLDDFEILGRKMKPVLPGGTGLEKLDTFRQAFGDKENILELGTRDDEEGDEKDEMYDAEEETKERWDCESILSTYTNLENHPRIIRARTSKPVPKIHIESKTGMPYAESQRVTTTKSSAPSKMPKESLGTNETITRPKNESAEDKKARKAAVKQQRAARRADKKATKEMFERELQSQGKLYRQRVEEKGIRKL